MTATNNILTFIDLFAGLGGFHIALESLGCKCVFTSELKEDLQKLYKINFPDAPRIEGDITKVDLTSIPHHDILCAGFPCQPFSQAGKRQGFSDEGRGNMFDYICAIIEERGKSDDKPRFLLLENVSNLKGHDNGNTWRIIQERLDALGYYVSGEILSPHQFGIPQHRKRIYIVGLRKDLLDSNEYQPFEFPNDKNEKLCDITTIIVVYDVMADETVHTPPDAGMIPEFAKDLCDYFNDKNTTPYLHPIIRGIIIHFMIGFFHPFVDGNGKTARALFYWYMLKEGYWMTEYLSISRVIAKSKKAYEKAYLYTEKDEFDLGYFINYNLKVLEQAYNELKNYIQRKQAEKQMATNYIQLGNINERQAQIIHIYTNKPNEILTVKDLQGRFDISPTTAKQDLIGLVDIGLLNEISLNKIKKGYVKSDKFEEIISSINDR